MKILITILACLTWYNVFSQEMSTQYFFINKNDPLIKKQLATNKNNYEGYTIINKNKIVKKYIRTSKIDGDDIEIETFDSISFTFNREKDTIVNESYLKQIDLIKDT